MYAYCAEHRWDHLGGPPAVPQEGRKTGRSVDWASDGAEIVPTEARHRLEAKKRPSLPCMDCGTDERLPRKKRCKSCHEIEEDRLERQKNAAHSERRRAIREAIQERPRTEHEKRRIA
jgi:hypothetical protein